MWNTEYPLEVREVVGLNAVGEVERIELFPASSPVSNPAFDVTPARYVTALVTEYGICPANRDALDALADRIGSSGEIFDTQKMKFGKPLTYEF